LLLRRAAQQCAKFSILAGLHNDLTPISAPETVFRHLFDTYVDRVHEYIYTITRSSYLSEEVCQELFLILWRKKEDLQEIQNMEQYIFRIARNLAIRLLQKAAHDGKMASEWYKRLPKVTHAVEENSNAFSAEQLIEQAVNALPAQPKKVYLLSRNNYMNFEEIAAELHLSRNTVKNHLNKALNDIREYLLKNGYQPVSIAFILLQLFVRKSG
jgi:RNA polymerase sigma-70 factor (family 1)